MEKTSKRALRSGCKRCGSGREPDYLPAKLYWWQDGIHFVLADEHGNRHTCPGGAMVTTDNVPVSGPELAGTDMDPDGPSVPADPAAVLKAAMEEFMTSKLTELGLAPAAPVTAPTASSTGKPAGPSVPAKAGTWELVRAAAANLPRVLLYGPPGTGKTYLAMQAGVHSDLPVYRVNMTEDTPAAELRGHYVPAGDGVWSWQDGPAMRAFRTGGRLVIDEITRAADDSLSFLLAVLDGHKITLPTGEAVESHPDMSVWATTNDGPEALTDALADRFTVRIECNEVNPEALATLPKNLARIVTAGNNGGVSFREAAEYHRLSSLPEMQSIAKAIGRDLAAEFVWGKRGRDVAQAIEMGTKLT